MTMPEQNEVKEREQSRDGHTSSIAQDRPTDPAIDALFFDSSEEIVGRLGLGQLAK
jgi:hypothetical protein